jgi:hypothetical protein
MPDDRSPSSLTISPQNGLDFAQITLSALSADIWQALDRAAVDRHSPWHTTVVATSDAAGVPDLRTVVLRGCDPVARTLRFHTDRRSAKIDVLRANPQAALLFYDPASKVQLRARGPISLVTHGPFFEQVWTETALMSRRCYLTDPPPGTVADRPITGLPGDLGQRRPRAEESEAGRANFTLAIIRVAHFDWLHLAADGHRRAQFSWDLQGNSTAQWVAP